MNVNCCRDDEGNPCKCEHCRPVEPPTAGELAYAVIEEKWIEARNLAEAYYAAKARPVVTSPDDDWDDIRRRGG